MCVSIPTSKAKGDDYEHEWTCAQYGAMLIGSHNQKLFSTGSMVLPEALKLTARPEGFDTVFSKIKTRFHSNYNNIPRFGYAEAPLLLRGLFLFC